MLRIGSVGKLCTVGLFLLPLICSATFGDFLHTGDSHLHLHRHDHLFHHLGNHVDVVMGRVEKRQAESPPTTSPTSPTSQPPPLSGDATNIDFQSWDEQTSEACMAALAQVVQGKETNPTGIAVCYNLPFLDKVTGVFRAELRMYNISAPFDDWAGVRAQDVRVGLSYLGATVQVANSNVRKRDLSSQVLWKRQEEVITMSQMKVLPYVGRVNDNLLGDALDNTQLQNLIVPTILLSAKNPITGKTLDASLSSSGASFVNGIFSASATRTGDSEAAQASASIAVAIAAPAEIPGVTFGVFPLSMIITLSWTFLFIAAVGFGTMRRIQFRAQYRRRVKRDMAMGMQSTAASYLT